MELIPGPQEILVFLLTCAVGAMAYWSKFSFSTNALLSITWNWASFWQATGKKVLLKTAQGSLPLVLVAMLASPAVQPALALTPGAAVGPAQALPVQPELAQLALQQPKQEVAVIVQKTGPGTDLEAEVDRLGGTVTQDLHIINAFGAQLSAQNALALAQAPGVRWVSLDAPTVSTSTETVDFPAIDPNSIDYAMDAMAVSMTDGSPNPMYITWATAQGSVVANAFTNATAMYDSALGPNGTFGYGGDRIKGSFGGFEAQVTPGTNISKVELVLHAYMPKYVAKVIKYQVYVGGAKVVEVKPNTSIFYANIGFAHAGPVYIDVTGTRSWQWTDFANSLEVAVDHSGISSEGFIYYDAIGLRVTSVDGSGEVIVADGEATALETVITTEQQNVYNQVIRASDLWNTSTKIQGKGVGVAVIDSGVQKTKDLGKRLRVNINFNKTFHNSFDRYGHGTFVAGIIAGNGSQSLKKYIGVAPRADIYNIRVSDDTGMASESDVITALQWIYDNKADTNIRVVNLSLNSSLAQSYHTSPLDAACEILWFNGIVVVVAAGNNGDSVIYPPANDPFVITVGATNDLGTLDTSDDAVTSFSAHGVTADGFSKPDLVAPGKNIIGLLPDHIKLTISMMHPNHRVDQNYFRMSGTSVSAPMVSGAVALLLQDEPDLTPDQVKYRLTATANQGWAGYDPYSAGAGYLDVYAAVNGTSTESANTGLTASSLLTTGDEPVNSSVSWNSVSWNSVSWNSVSWNSVSWNSVSWNSVSWNSVSWNSDYWDE